MRTLHHALILRSGQRPRLEGWQRNFEFSDLMVRDGAACGVVAAGSSTTGTSYIVPGNAPPSSKMFWPVMKPALALHSQAQA